MYPKNNPFVRSIIACTGFVYFINNHIPIGGIKVCIKPRCFVAKCNSSFIGPTLDSNHKLTNKTAVIANIM